MQFKKMREWLLVVLGVVTTILLVWMSLYLLFFLVKKLNQSLTFEPRAIRATEFDTEGFEKLNLTQETKK